MALSLYQQHVWKWKNGCGSCLCPNATKVVLAKGKVPCDILFVGEAPGVSEDVIGIPFVGPAGKLLERIVHISGAGAYRCAYTNIVGCIPLEEDGSKTSEPPEEAIEACKPRLEEFVVLAAPRLVVCVGRLAGDCFSPGYRHSTKIPAGTNRVVITHPSAILRARIDQRGLQEQRATLDLSHAVEEVFKKK